MKMEKLYNNILIFGIIYYFIEVCILHWLTLDDSIKYCSILLIGTILSYKFFYKKEKIKINKLTTLLFFLFIIYILINILFTEDHSIIVSRIIYYIITPISIYSFFIFLTENIKIDEKYIKKTIPIILNIYFFINIPILIIQCQGTGFLMLNLNSNYSNHLYVDHISGLLGLDGTHKLGLLTIAVIFVNIYSALKTKKMKYYIITIIDIIFILVLSLYNDNKALFIVLPLVLLPVFYSILKIQNNKLFKGTFVVLSICILGVIIYMLIPNVQIFLEEKIFYLFDENNSNNFEEQERTFVVKYSLEEGNGYLIGKGIGCKMPKLEPKAHFGINDMSILIYEGGVIYLILWILIITELLYKCVCGTDKNLKIKIAIFLYTFLFAYYDQIITNWKQAFLYALIFLMYRNIYYYIKDYKKEN